MIDPAVGRDDIFGVADARASRWKDIVAALRSLAGAISALDAGAFSGSSVSGEPGGPESAEEVATT